MTKELQICNHRDYLTNYLFKKFPRARKEDIEDAVQNAIIKAVRHSDKWQGNCSLKTWLSVIAVNMYTDTFRKTYTKNEYLLKTHEDSFVFDKIYINDFSDNICEIEHENQLTKVLFSGFDDNIHIQTFKLSVFEEVDYKDIAILCNIPIGTVKSRVFRARKLLQEKYEKYLSSNQS
jgi:RNA polymerase sigma-70 factor (ECF subfamily)